MEQLYNALMNARDKADDLQTQVYILAGVFGGTILFLIFTTVILAVVAHKLQKKLNDDIAHRKVTEEMNKRRFSAYTGEEIQRQLTAATISAATPLPSYQSAPVPKPIVNASAVSTNKEYAFNTPEQGGRGVYTLQNTRKF